MYTRNYCLFLLVVDAAAAAAVVVLINQGIDLLLSQSRSPSPSESLNAASLEWSRLWAFLTTNHCCSFLSHT